MNVFMIKVVLKNSELSGYKWVNNKDSHLDGFVEVKAGTLKQAVERVKEVYSDKDKYWVKADESYMLLK